MNEPARRVATYEDVLASPEHVVAELIEGVLYQSPRPSSLHGAAASAVGEELGAPFKRGKGGPGGWIILDEPELHLQRRPPEQSVPGASPDFSPRLGEGRSPATGRADSAGASSSSLRSPQAVLAVGPDIVVPDVAGWRRSTMPELPDVAFFDVRPDWVCEVASPSTRALDRGKKLALYERAGVSHVWLIEPHDQFLEVLELDGPTYRIIDRAAGTAPRRLRPFDAIEFDVGALWAR